MIQDRYVINGSIGPNECLINHYVQNQIIEVDSEAPLMVQDMRLIEEYLNLDTQLGWRGNISTRRMVYGTRYITTWHYLEACDVDWS